MQFVKPNEKYLQSYYEACKETWGYVHNNYIIHNPNEFDDWKNHIFQDYKNQAKGINLLEGYVPSVTYWMILNEKYIGTINIRLKLNDNLKKYGGHIGGIIRKSERGKSYGKQSLLWSINKAAELNIHPLLITCQENNEKSLNMLIKTGKYYKTEKDIARENGKIQFIRRFWYE